MPTLCHRKGATNGRFLREWPASPFGLRQPRHGALVLLHVPKSRHTNTPVLKRAGLDKQIRHNATDTGYILGLVAAIRCN
jgi:hypothetical protein